MPEPLQQAEASAADEDHDVDGELDADVDPAEDAAGDSADEPGAHEPELSDLTRLKRRNGVATAMLAGALFGLRDVLESPKETAPVTVESSSEPTDIDSEGMSIPIDDRTTAVAPPQRNSRQPARRRAPRRRRKRPA